MQKQDVFTSKIGVVMAAAGSAVGLGNIWRFPTEVGSNGGAVFILIYILCILLIGVPVMLCEFIIGRHTHTNTIDAYQKLAPGKWWRIQGVNGVFVAFLILSYYIVIAGWTLYYLVQAAMANLTADVNYTVRFQEFVSSPWEPLIYTMLFMGMTHWVVIRGVQSGIEKFSKVMMPMLLLIIGMLVVCSFSMPGTSQGLQFLLHPDFSKINATVVLSAMGQAFFSLSLAMGCLCTYASYFGENTNLVKTALNVSIIDTMVAILSGFFIFPAVFSVSGVEVNAGPGLVFITLPNVFNMAFHNVPVIGYCFALLFYILLLLAALTSSISLHESVTAYIKDQFKLSRHVAARYVSASCFLLGILCALSFGPLKEATLFGLTVFELFDFISSKILLPMGGILICLFTGWYLNRQLVLNELTNQGKLTFKILHVFIFLIRYIVPLAIASVFLHELIL